MVRVTRIGQTTAEATKPEQEIHNLSAGDLVLRAAQVRYAGETDVTFQQVVLPSGTRLSELDRITYTTDGIPVEWCVTFWQPNR